MKHVFRQKVFYSDTDSYGVVWHGNYLRWLEMGRCMFCEESGYKLSELENQDIVLPVVDLKIQYKNSAKLDDTVVIETEIMESNKFCLVFHQKVLDEKREKTYINATVTVVAIHKDGKLYRSLPEPIQKICVQ